MIISVIMLRMTVKSISENYIIRIMIMISMNGMIVMTMDRRNKIIL